jgi:hypothetical protein
MGDREPSQGRKAAALSGFVCVPQVTWLLRTTARGAMGRNCPAFCGLTAIAKAGKS